MLRAAITSAWPARLREIQDKVAWLGLFLASIAPHAGTPSVRRGTSASSGGGVSLMLATGFMAPGILQRVEEKQGAAFLGHLKATVSSGGFL